MLQRFLLTVALVITSFTLSARADIERAPQPLKLPAIFSDNMVLQQSAEVPVWGWGGGEPGDQLTLSGSWNGAAAVVQTAQIAKDNTWRFTLRTPSAADAANINNGSHILTISGKSTVTFSNVAIGEVWLCSGQSNMEWPLWNTDNGDAAVKAASHPQIRLFMVENAVAVFPQTDCKGNWLPCTPESAKNFSAVGYYFGAALQKELNVPIGLIASDWGGTPAEAWTSEETMRSFPDFASQMATVDAIRKQEREGPAKGAADAAMTAWLKQLDEADPGSRDPKVDPRSGWSAEAFDDSKWAEMDMPALWPGDLANFDGFVWFRTTFDVPTGVNLNHATLSLGAIDDCDTTWINGTKVGESMGQDAFNKPRTYKIPDKILKHGKNVIAIRMLDTGGPGGMTATADQLRIELGNDDGKPWKHSLAGKWKYAQGTAAAQLPQRPVAPGPGPNLATNLYNGMIAPIAGFGIRGAIWYQGESNRDRAFQYRFLFPAMIRDWRTQWAKAAAGPLANSPNWSGSGPKNDFPFYFVQIAPFNYGGDQGEAAELREAQFLTMKTVPNTGMAVTMDIGNPADIHPRNKADVGRRLSLWALAKTYGKQDVVYSGPVYIGMKADSGKIRLGFEQVGGGLDSGGKPLTHFTIAGEDIKFVPAKASIDDNTIVVYADSVPKPVAVRYAWGTADEPNLKNKAGLPASSFRTDEAPGLTQPKPKPKSGGLRKPFKLEDGRKLVLDAPIDRWDEAIPLGNGLLGGLLWGGDNTINLSLDRGDLWDLRTPDTLKRPDWNYATMKKLVAAKDHDALVKFFDEPYDAVPYPTKLPGGRLVIHLDESLKAKSFSLDLRWAEATIDAGTPIHSFFSATSPVGFLTYLGPSA